MASDHVLEGIEEIATTACFNVSEAKLRFTNARQLIIGTVNGTYWFHGSIHKIAISINRNGLQSQAKTISPPP